MHLRCTLVKPLQVNSKEMIVVLCARTTSLLHSAVPWKNPPFLNQRSRMLTTTWTMVFLLHPPAFHSELMKDTDLQPLGRSREADFFLKKAQTVEERRAQSRKNVCRCSFSRTNLMPSLQTKTSSTLYNPPFSSFHIKSAWASHFSLLCYR